MLPASAVNRARINWSGRRLFTAHWRTEIVCYSRPAQPEQEVF
jgi:hypothetical protein